MGAFCTAKEVDVKSDHKNRLLLCGVPCVLSYLHGFGHLEVVSRAQAGNS